MYTPFDDDPSPSGIDYDATEKMDSDESDEYYDEQGRKVMEVDYSKMEYSGPKTSVSTSAIGGSGSCASAEGTKKQGPTQPVEIGYTMVDMTPTIRDPRCTSNTELACFWPVYVGNFKDDDVPRYFATHGLHVRWWYRRPDAYFREFQCKARLYDMLVYFVSKRDAELAVERCHRDVHKGYTLNVFPGREAVYFPEDRSVYAEDIEDGRIFSEEFFEQQVLHYCEVQVRCVVKFDMHSGAVEFESPDEVWKAQQTERKWTFRPVQGKLRKQRFLEQDVIGEIETFLAQNPSTLKVKPDDKILRTLLVGRIPQGHEKKQYRVKPLLPPKYRRQRYRR